MTWTFFQKSGALFNNDMMTVAIGYAGGNEGKNPEGKNNPDMQDVACVGPLPEGTYTIIDMVPQSHLGPFALRLEPDNDNEMFGRGDFYIHGDRIKSPGDASEGCMIFPRAVRELIWNSTDHVVNVVKGE